MEFVRPRCDIYLDILMVFIDFHSGKPDYDRSAQTQRRRISTGAVQLLKDAAASLNGARFYGAYGTSFYKQQWWSSWV